MTKSISLTNSQNRGDGCSKLITCENVGTVPWSDLDHNLLHLTMMKLQVFDFVPFSGVCKSWRSLALPNKTKFMASRPPISISISKMPLPRSIGRTFVGLTCGYLVLYGKKTRDFWLVNPVTRHGLHFPKRHGDQFPKIFCNLDTKGARAILVFSHSVSAWVFVFLWIYTKKIWYSIAGTGAWNYVDSDNPIGDLHEFKGNIYVIDTSPILYELRLDLEPNLTLLDTNKIVLRPLFVKFLSSGEKLYALDCFSEDSEVYELDFGEMKWVSPEEKTMEEHVFFLSKWKHNAVIKRELLLDSWWRYKKYAYTSGNKMFCTADIWYFSHDCMKVEIIHESYQSYLCICCSLFFGWLLMGTMIRYSYLFM